MSASGSWDDLKSILAQADQARAAQDELRAQTLYVRATQLDPNNAVAWAGRAAMSFDPDDSIVSWGYAVSLAPQDEQARAVLTRRIQERIVQSVAADAPDLVALGRDVAQAGQKLLAHQIFTRATELAENDSTAWVWRAGSADSIDEAVGCLHRALALDPENWRAEAGLQWILSQKIAPTPFASPGMVRQAASQVAHAQHLLSAGEKTRAHELFVHATELDSHNEAAWLWRASTTQDVDQALLFVEQALRLNPKNPVTLQARKFLRARLLRAQPQSIAPAAEPIAPINFPEAASLPTSPTWILWLAIALFVVLILLYNYLRMLGFFGN